MKKKPLLITFAVCVALCLMLTVFVEPADAQDSDSTKKIDKKSAQKRGVSQSLADGKDKKKDGDGPTKLQMGLGIGSVFVMIAVVKWL